MRNRQYYGSIDIGGTKIRMGLVSENGEVIARNMFLTPAKKTWEQVLQKVIYSFSDLVDENDLTHRKISGIGLGCPGTFDLERSTISFAPNLNWRNVPIKEYLREHIPVPVWPENDTNLSTLGVAHFGEGRKVENLIGIFIGTGIGGGIITGKKLFIGSTGAAGEIGHMVIRHKGRRCTCGNRGCLESIASTKSIYRRINRLYKKFYRGTSTYDEFVSSANKSLAIKYAYQSGEEIAVNIVHEAFNALSMMIVSLINMINPEMVVLGGGLIETLGDVVIERTVEAVNNHAMPGTSENVQIIRTSLGDDAPIVGGAALVRQKLQNVNN